MKIFDTRFFGGAFLTGLGLLSVIVGALSLLHPVQNDTVISGIALVLLGIPLVVFGRRYAKDAPPPASKVAVETLRRAGMLDKKRKK